MIIPMENLRTYGTPPFNIAVIHGGPGAAGEMAPVARQLATTRGVLEPLQTADSIQGQIGELKTTLQNNANLPATLIGFSWGAWLSFILAANHPELVKRLILVSSGPFEEKYVANLQETRLSRLSQTDRTEVESLIKALNNPSAKDKNKTFARLGALISKADAYDLIIDEPETAIDCGYDIYQKVWNQAAKLRSTGQLLKLAKQIKCPVTAIHGDHDPHPAKGVQIPLSTTIKNFKFTKLKNCGHKPWTEKQAKNNFYKILKTELR